MHRRVLYAMFDAASRGPQPRRRPVGCRDHERLPGDASIYDPVVHWPSPGRCYPLVDGQGLRPGNDPPAAMRYHRSPAAVGDGRCENRRETVDFILTRRPGARADGATGSPNLLANGSGIAVGIKPISRRTTCVSWPTRCSGRWRITTPTKEETLAAVMGRVKAFRTDLVDPRHRWCRWPRLHSNAQVVEVEEDSRGRTSLVI